MSNANESAFPNATERRPDGEITQWATPGLTKRELFAAMAMQGMLANPSLDMYPYDMAVEAKRRADFLLHELAKDGAA